MREIWLAEEILACKEELLNFIFVIYTEMYEGWNFNSGNYLCTTDTK